MKNYEITFPELVHREAQKREDARRRRVEKMGRKRLLPVRPIGDELYWINLILEKCSHEPSGCIVFNGSRSKDGYGCFNLGNLSRAHRIMYVLCFGLLPFNLSVCHKCDNPPCVNPEHLFAGTVKDNVRDSITKGRFHRASGERNGNSRLSDSQVKEIRDIVWSNQVGTKTRYGLIPVLMKKYNTTGRTIRNIALCITR